MNQRFQEWSKQNLWKTAFEKFEVKWSDKRDHIISNFLKTVIHKFYLVQS